MNTADTDLMRAEDDGMIPPARPRVAVGETIVGVPHVVSHAAYYSECRCGCRFTDGLPGTVIEVSRELDLVIVEFMIPSPVGGDPVRHLTAFSHAEARS